MGRVLLLLGLGLCLQACATSLPKRLDTSTSNLICRDGYVPLFFDNNASSLNPVSLEGLSLAARAHWVCPEARLRIVGLPPPSDASLQGRRSQSLNDSLEAFGVPPSSLLRTALTGRGQPLIQIRARPPKSTGFGQTEALAAQARLWSQSYEDGEAAETPPSGQ